MAIKNPDLNIAIADLRKRKPRYQKYRDYYNGIHALAYASEKFTNAFGDLFRAFADNLCPAIVDTLVDRLKVQGFGFPKGAKVPEGSQNKLLVEADSIWTRNRMDRRSGEIHLEASLTGDAFVIIWPNKKGEPIIYPNKADRMVISYSEEEPGGVDWAAKVWTLSDKRQRVNLYYPDRIEKYVSRPEAWGAMASGAMLSATSSGAGGDTGASEPSLFGMDFSAAYEVFDGDNDGGLVRHDYGRVPVFHFANNASLGEYGRSELQPATPLQDALNKSIADMLVAMEFAAYPQRWATGIQPIVDPTTGKQVPPFVPGVDRLWATAKETAGFGQFPQADLTQFLSVSEGFRLEAARVTNTPVHYMTLTPGNFPSGEALKTAETPLTAKATDRTLSHGETWAEAMQFCLLLSNPSQARDIQLETQWADVAPTSKTDIANFLAIMKDIKDPVLLKKAGFTEDEIAEMQLGVADLGTQLMGAFTNGSAPLTGRSPGATQGTPQGTQGLGAVPNTPNAPSPNTSGRQRPA